MKIVYLSILLVITVAADLFTLILAVSMIKDIFNEVSTRGEITKD